MNRQWNWKTAHLRCEWVVALAQEKSLKMFQPYLSYQDSHLISCPPSCSNIWYISVTRGVKYWTVRGKPWWCYCSRNAPAGTCYLVIGPLQLPASWPPDICHQTPTTDPECCSPPDIQRSQIYAHHPPAHWPLLAACYSSHQIQDIGACIPGSQGISPRLHPTAHQTLHTCQTSTLCYLWASGAPPPVTPAHLFHDSSLFWPHDGGMTFL